MSWRVPSISHHLFSNLPTSHSDATELSDEMYCITAPSCLRRLACCHSQTMSASPSSIISAMLPTSSSSSSGSSSLVDNLLFLPLAPSLRAAHSSRSDVELVSSSSDIRAELSQESRGYPCCFEEAGGQDATARRRVEKMSEARLGY